MAAAVVATGPPSPMFSPAAVQLTPAAVSRAPRAGSPGHWWDRPQPAAISWLCRAELTCRPLRIVYAGSPACARAWLISARTLLAAAESAPPGDGCGDGDVAAGDVAAGDVGEPADGVAGGLAGE